MEKLKGAIRMFGGKGNMTNQITKYFPENGTYDTYIEPFSATYSVGLLINPHPLKFITILKKMFIHYIKYYQTKYCLRNLKKKCDLAFYNEDIRKEFKENLTKDDMSIVERAFYFFMLIEHHTMVWVGFLKTYMYEEI